MLARMGHAAMLVASLLVALATTAGAQPRVEEKANLAVTGDVEAIDVAGRKLTLVSAHDETVVYDVDAAATIMYENRKIDLGDLKVGWNVAANGHELRGSRTLSYIKVVKAPAP